MLDREVNELGAALDVERPHDLVLVELCGTHGNAQDSGDLLRGFPLCQQLEHLQLATGQGTRELSRPVGVPRLPKLLRDRGGDERFVPRGMFLLLSAA